MVSVIIPTYNRINTLLESIKSVQNQTYEDIEIIIVDDASTDGTDELISPLVTDKLRYIRNEKNMGVAATRNVGIAHARGEFIAFNDSDDYWRRTKLEKQMNVMDENPECMFVYCAFERQYLDGRKERIPSKREKVENLQGDIFECLLKRNTISTQTMLFRKRCFDEIGLFDERMKTIDDYEMALRLSQNYHIYYVDEVLVDVVMSQNSVSVMSKNYYKHFLDLYYIIGSLKNNVKSIKQLDALVAQMANCFLYMSKDEIMSAVDVCNVLLSDSVFLESMILGLAKSGARNLYKDRAMCALSQNGCEKKFMQLANKKIAIYGNGYVGKRTREVLDLIDIEDIYVIDKHPQQEECDVYPLTEDLPKVDLIIITVYDVNGSIEKDIQSITGCNTIHLQKILGL